MANTIDVAKVREIIEAGMREWGVPGMAVGLVNDGEVIFAEGFGVREAGKPEPFDADTVFRIGSCTKPFTADAIGILVDEGLLDWDDPVVDYLPDFRLSDPGLTTRVTVRDLLAHRVSVDSFNDDEAFQMKISRDEIVRMIRYDEPIPAFRGQMVYNNMLYTVAGQLIPATTGLSWDEFIKQRIFKPLGMTTASTTGYALNATPNHASLHHPDEHGVMKPFPIPQLGPDDVETIAPPGGVNASINELLPWLRLHMNGDGQVDGVRLYGEAVAREMHTGQILIHPNKRYTDPETGRTWNYHEEYEGTALADHTPEMYVRDGVPFRPDVIAYAFGWILDWHRGHRLIQHRGHYWAHSSASVFLPDLQIGVFLGCNSTRPGTLGFSQMLLDYLLGIEPGDWLTRAMEKSRAGHEAGEREWQATVAARKTGTQPTLPLDGYVGLYQFRPFDQWDVTVVDGALRMERRNQYSPFYATLEHWQDDTFFAHWNIAEPAQYQPARLVSFNLTPENTPRGMDFFYGNNSHEYLVNRPGEPSRQLRFIPDPEMG